MNEEPATIPSSSSASDIRGREHARRHALQEEILRRAYQRSVHRSYIEAALRRAGRTALPVEAVNAHLLRSRSID